MKILTNVMCDECVTAGSPDFVVIKFWDSYTCENCIQDAVNLIREHYELADDE